MTVQLSAPYTDPECHNAQHYRQLEYSIMLESPVELADEQSVLVSSHV